MRGGGEEEFGRGPQGGVHQQDKRMRRDAAAASRGRRRRRPERFATFAAAAAQHARTRNGRWGHSIFMGLLGSRERVGDAATEGRSQFSCVG